MYRKDIFTHTRIKPKKESTFGIRKQIKKKRITNDDELCYLNWLQTVDAACMVCGSNEIHWHHVKLNSSDKKDHKRLIPLCISHHVGNELSPHGTPKHWRETYSMEFQYSVADKYYKEYQCLLK